MPKKGGFMQISVRNIQKNYRKKEVLKDISLEAESGSRIGILGRNDQNNLNHVGAAGKLFGGPEPDCLPGKRDIRLFPAKRRGGTAGAESGPLPRSGNDDREIRHTCYSVITSMEISIRPNGALTCTPRTRVRIRSIASRAISTPTFV